MLVDHPQHHIRLLVDMVGTDQLQLRHRTGDAGQGAAGLDRRIATGQTAGGRRVVVQRGAVVGAAGRVGQVTGDVDLALHQTHLLDAQADRDVVIRHLVRPSRTCRNGNRRGRRRTGGVGHPLLAGHVALAVLLGHERGQRSRIRIGEGGIGIQAVGIAVLHAIHRVRIGVASEFAAQHQAELVGGLPVHIALDAGFLAGSLKERLETQVVAGVLTGHKARILGRRRFRKRSDRIRIDVALAVGIAQAQFEVQRFVGLQTVQRIQFVLMVAGVDHADGTCGIAGADRVVVTPASNRIVLQRQVQVMILLDPVVTSQLVLRLVIADRRVRVLGGGAVNGREVVGVGRRLVVALVKFGTGRQHQVLD